MLSSKINQKIRESHFVVQNKLKIRPSMTHAFENIWVSRTPDLQKTTGLLSYNLLIDAEKNGDYISQTIWKSQDYFQKWLNSDDFVYSHGVNDPLKTAKLRIVIIDHETDFFHLVYT